MDFFRDLAVNPLLLSSFAGGLLAAVARGAMGPYVITRRMVSLAGAIADIVIGGLGAVIFLRYQFRPYLDGLQPLHGAVVAALLAAVIIDWCTARPRAARHAAGCPLGRGHGERVPMLIEFTPGYQEDLLGYLFGNLSVVDWHDALLVLTLDVAILLVLAMFDKRFMALCLDEEFVGLQAVSGAGYQHPSIGPRRAGGRGADTGGGIDPGAGVAGPAGGTPAGTLPRGRMGLLIVLSIALCMALVSVPRVAVIGTQIAPESVIVLGGCGLSCAALWRRFGQKTSSAQW